MSVQCSSLQPCDGECVNERERERECVRVCVGVCVCVCHETSPFSFEKKKIESNEVP